MNLAVICGGCGTTFRVMQQENGTDVDALVGSHSEFWQDKYTCPKCESSCTGMFEEDLPRGMQTKDIVDLTPEEMLSAQYGMGLPGDKPPTFGDVSNLLIDGTIKWVGGHDVAGTGRCVLERLVFTDGTVLHLGASSHGAVAYRVVKPRSLAERVEGQR